MTNLEHLQGLTTHEKRKWLMSVCAPFMAAVESGDAETVNEGIIKMYREQYPDIKDFKTFKQWKAAGFNIKKGSTAFLVWGRPKSIKQTQDDSEKAFKFFPLAYLFSDLQVEKMERRAAA